MPSEHTDADYRWSVADRISDRIVDVLRDELKSSDPLQIYAGLLLAFHAFADTAPPNRPAVFDKVLEAASECLTAMLHDHPQLKE